MRAFARGIDFGSLKRHTRNNRHARGRCEPDVRRPLAQEYSAALRAPRQMKSRRCSVPSIGVPHWDGETTRCCYSSRAWVCEPVKVTTLCLQDIDWQSGLLTIRGKGRQRAQMPLSREVGARDQRLSGTWQASDTVATTRIATFSRAEPRSPARSRSNPCTVDNVGKTEVSSTCDSWSA